MRGLLLRHVLRRYLVLVGAVLAGLLVVFLVADFVDRARAYTGPNWVRDVLELYGWKGVVATHQLAPAALLLASATLVSLLRRRGELTAILALGFGRRALILPVGAVALGAALVLGLLDELVVGHASRRVDEITALRFHRWGDWRSYFERKQWFRHQDRILHLESGDVDSGFRGVTVLRLTPEFELAERVDALGMEHAGGTRWRLRGVTRRVFDRRGGLRLTELPEETVDLGIPASLLAIRPGRPEQMRVPVLRQQIRARREVGLPDRLYLLALGNRFAYPLAGVPAALVAVVSPGWHARLGAAIENFAGGERALARGAGWDLVHQHPWLGVGFGNYRAAALGRASVTGITDQLSRDAHSIALTTWAETGLPGLVLWVLLHAALLRALLRRARKGNTVALGAALSWIGYQTLGIAHHLPFHPSVALGFALVWGVGLVYPGSALRGSAHGGSVDGEGLPGAALPGVGAGSRAAGGRPAGT